MASGPVVVVTGASAGLGGAIAHAFAREGAQVLATDINVNYLKSAMTGAYRDWAFRETPRSIRDPRGA